MYGADAAAVEHAGDLLSYAQHVLLAVQRAVTAAGLVSIAALRGVGFGAVGVNDEDLGQAGVGFVHRYRVLGPQQRGGVYRKTGKILDVNPAGVIGIAAAGEGHRLGCGARGWAVGAVVRDGRCRRRRLPQILRV